MALKGDRYEAITDISFNMNEVASRGGVATISTVGSGSALDQSAALVTYAAAPSGNQPVGILMNDMVNIDQTRQHINWHKDEMQKGSKVRLLMEGFVVTNFIDPGVTPAAGDPAYVGPSGYIRNTGGVGTTDNDGSLSGTGGQPLYGALIGRFLSTKDEDGYAKVYVKLTSPDVAVRK
jgi:hypothetical protein